MQIAIVGAGAIGSLFAAHLQRSGQNILLVHHKRRIVEAIKKRGVTIIGPSRRRFHTRIEIRQELSGKENPDLVLLTVKAYDTETAAKSLANRLPGSTQILSLQNGLGNIEILSRYFPKQSLMAATTTEAALQVNPGRIYHTGRGTTWIGDMVPTRSRQSNLVSVLRAAGFAARATANIEGVLWSKAIVNSAINPITALIRLTNVQLLRSLDLMEAAMSLVNEGVRVARARGVSLTPPPTSWLSSVLRSSKNNRSSMLRDIETGQKTEIRQLNGWIVSEAKRLGVDAACNAIIERLLLGLEGHSDS